MYIRKEWHKHCTSRHIGSNWIVHIHCTYQPNYEEKNCLPKPISYVSIIILIALYTVAFKNMSSHRKSGIKNRVCSFFNSAFVMLIICNGNKHICIKVENGKIETFSQVNFWTPLLWWNVKTGHISRQEMIMDKYNFQLFWNHCTGLFSHLIWSKFGIAYY